MFKVLLQSAADPAPVEVVLHKAGADGRYAVRVGGHPLELALEPTGAGVGWLRVRSRVLPVCTAREGDRVHVWLAGRTFVFDLARQTPRRVTGVAAGPRCDSLAAPMPGAVLKIHVAPGARVQAHEPLIVMESMKMELTLSAPHAARVREIRCQPGQLVELGAVLLTLEDADDAATA